MKTVAVLCAARRSNYYGLPGVDVYGPDRDCRAFHGGMPVVAHPPCRAWSAFCRHQAYPSPGERELGLWCAEWLVRVGGILEHPAHSTLFAAAGLPRPGEAPRRDLWTVEVCQHWFDATPTRKRTWLCFSRIDVAAVSLPPPLPPPADERRNWRRLSKAARALTGPNLARWLVATARLVPESEAAVLELRHAQGDDAHCRDCGCKMVGGRHVGRCPRCGSDRWYRTHLNITNKEERP